mgnify:CR=1 FL=1
MRGRQQTDSVPIGASERAAPVTEQLRLQKPLRDRRAVEGTHGPIAAVAVVVERARNAVLRNVPPERLMSRYDWLYGWRAT